MSSRGYRILSTPSSLFPPDPPRTLSDGHPPHLRASFEMSSENKNSHPQRDGSSRGTTLVPRQQTLPAGALISCDALANGGRVRRSLLRVPDSGYLRSVRGSGGIFVGTFRVCFHRARLAGRPFPATRLRRSRCRFDSRSTPRGQPHGGPPHHGPRKIRLVQGKGEVKGKTRGPFSSPP